MNGSHFTTVMTLMWLLSGVQSIITEKNFAFFNCLTLALIILSFTNDTIGEVVHLCLFGSDQI